MFRLLKVWTCATKLPVRLKCLVCGKKHYVILCKFASSLGSHKDGKNGKHKDSKGKGHKPPPDQQTTSSQLGTASSSCSVSLQTLIIKLVADNGNCEIVRALCDNGSQRSYVTTQCARKLGLKSSENVTLSHALFGGFNKSIPHDVFVVTVKNVEETFSFQMPLLSQKVICANLPSLFHATHLQDLQANGVQLHEVEYPGLPIDVLFGADILGPLYTGKLIQHPNGLTSFETKLGWVVMGPVINNTSSNFNFLQSFNLFNETYLWDLEILGIRDPIEVQTREQKFQQILENFRNDVQINDEGRIEVALPWKPGHPGLVSNKAAAFKRLQTLTKKLQSNKLFDVYHQVLKDWLQDNIIEEIPGETTEPEQVFYLPHRPVLREDHATTKIRPVFDGSAKTQNVSLNDCLETGPNLIDLIPAILIRFRLKPIGVVADIKKAFLQLSVNPKDRDVLRFLWWDDYATNKTITYRHRRVVFGLTPSPFLLGASIDYLLDSLSGQYPETIQQLRKAFYVDNCITSVQDENHLKTFKAESKAVMAQAKFELRAWVESGSQAVNTEEVTLVSPHVTLVLGSVLTDPYSLHIFTDASLQAYAAVIFIRIETTDGVRVQFVQSKARVTSCIKPTKRKPEVDKPNIHRLELTGAVLGVRLARSIISELPPQPELFFWTDSSTALSWIQRHEPWGTYVGNRVAEIRQSSDAKDWRYVPGTLNPADLPSRGCTAYQLMQSTWWEGPSWLKLDRMLWPQYAPEVSEADVLAERKKTPTVTATALDDKSDVFYRFFYFSSSYTRALRAIARTKRTAYNAHKPEIPKVGPLTNEEISTAETFALRWMQRDAGLYSDEFKKLYELSIDEKGIIRVKTRLLMREDDAYFNEPILLPSKHIVTQRIIEEIHRENMHAGTHLLVPLVRQRFWLAQSRRVIRHYISKCVPCLKFKAQAFKAPFAPLPEDRVKDADVFEVTGIDLAGPVYLRRFPAPEDDEAEITVKAWIVLFTCAIYRAVHFELVSFISSEAFIAALVRFISRRGRPSVIYSDNGTNFVGTDNYLNSINWDAVLDFAANKRITREKKVIKVVYG